MKLTIGENAFEITSAQPCRDLRFGVYLMIKIPKDNITASDIENVFDGNENTIVITKDDESTVEYNGYTELGKYECVDGFYNISQICVSEAQHQINQINNKFVSQETINASVQATLKTHADNTVAMNNTIEMQMASIDSLLLEVIPAVVSDAVTAAVAEALSDTENV